MKKITFPLQTGTISSAVADLKRAATLPQPRGILSGNNGTQRELTAVLLQEYANQVYKDAKKTVQHLRE